MAWHGFKMARTGEIWAPIWIIVAVVSTPTKCCDIVFGRSCCGCGCSHYTLLLGLVVALLLLLLVVVVVLLLLLLRLLILLLWCY